MVLNAHKLTAQTAQLTHGSSYTPSVRLGLTAEYSSWPFYDHLSDHVIHCGGFQRACCVLARREILIIVTYLM